MRPYLEPEGRRVGWLLTEIEAQTNGRLSEESRKGLVDEVVCHLDAAIQARLELGMSPIEAEYEAVAAFGPPKAYVDDLLKVHEQAKQPKQRITALRGDRRTMITFSIATLYACAWLLSGLWEAIPYALGIGSIVFAVIFSIYSFKSRKIRPIPIFLGSSVGFVLLSVSICLTWNNLWVHGGMGVMPKRQAEETLQLDLAAKSRIDALVTPLVRGMALHARNTTVAMVAKLPESDRNFMMTVPDPQNEKSGGLPIITARYVGSHASITYVPTNSFLKAAAAWKLAANGVYADLAVKRQDLQGEISAIQEAQSAPMFADLETNLVQNEVCIPVWGGLWAILNFIFAVLGKLFARVQIQIRPQAGHRA